MLRVVLFDLDGTLYDRDAAMAALAREQFAAFADRMPGVEAVPFIRRFLELDEHGYSLRPEVYRRLVDEFGLDASLAVDLERHFWECYTRRCDVTDDTRSTLQALRSAGKRLGIITNGQTAWQTKKLESLALGPIFDVVLVSETEGVSKPAPEIFARALARLGAAPADAMFVGDHPEFDIAGSRSAGLVPVWKRVPYWTLPFDDVLVVDRLSEILPALR